jgi:hypothetical protein
MGKGRTPNVEWERRGEEIPSVEQRMSNDEGKEGEQAPEDWFSEIGSGIKGVSRKLLDHVPPEIRSKVVEQARSHGPGAAAAAINAAALKTRNLKAKLALKTLGGLLKLLDSKGPKK